MRQTIIRTLESANQALVSPDAWSKSESREGGKVSLLQALPYESPWQFVSTLRYLASTLSSFKGWGGDHVTLIDFNADPAIQHEHVKALLEWALERLRKGVSHGLR